jgi:small subunit ribosomal protein S1
MPAKMKGASTVDVLPRKKVVKSLARGMEMQGRVRRVAGFGAFVDIGVGTDGLLHISELDPNRRVAQITDVVSVGDEVTVWVKDLDRESNRISLTMVPPGTLTVSDLHEGMIVSGKVTRLAPYGAFLDIGVGRDGMLHVREMGEGFVKAPEDVVKVGEELEVRVAAVDKRRARIDLSIKGLHSQQDVEETEDGAVEEAEPPTLMEVALREAMGDDLPTIMPRERSRKSHKRKRQQRQLDDIISRTIESHRQAA